MEFWKTIEVGGMRSSELLTGMIAEQIKIGAWVSVAVKSLPAIASPKRVVSFTQCEVADLGFSEMPTQKQIWEKVKKMYGLCTEDAAMYLRRHYMDQPVGECLFVIAKPIDWPLGNKSIFRLGCSNGDLHRQLRFQILPVDELSHWPLKQKITFQFK